MFLPCAISAHMPGNCMRQGTAGARTSGAGRTMAPRALVCAAVTTYSPLDRRASALAISGLIAALVRAILSFCVSACARSVPASS